MEHVWTSVTCVVGSLTCEVLYLSRCKHNRCEFIRGQLCHHGCSPLSFGCAKDMTLCRIESTESQH